LQVVKELLAHAVNARALLPTPDTGQGKTYQDGGHHEFDQSKTMEIGLRQIRREPSQKEKT
jgi:hypothetical protein